MKSKKLLQILGSIVTETFGLSVNNDLPLARQLDSSDWSRRISEAIEKALCLVLSQEEIESFDSLSQLSTLLESRLATDPAGRTIVDVYAVVERLSKEEYHPDIDYHWKARYDDFYDTGNWLTAPDSFDAVELIMRMEVEFEFSIPDLDAQKLRTVEQTVCYLWRRTCSPEFTLRQRGKGVCRSAFAFYELRRLMIIKANIQRRDVRLDLQLGNLMPTWHTHFWKQVQCTFNIEQPPWFFRIFSHQVEKNTTVRELVYLIASSSAKSDTPPLIN